MFRSLPLTAFEEYMLLDGTADHPMEFLIRLRFDGPLDLEALRVAAGQALDRHPILRSRIDRGNQRWPAAGPRFIFSLSAAVDPTQTDPIETGPRPSDSVVRLIHGSCNDDPDAYPECEALNSNSGPLVRLMAVVPDINRLPSHFDLIAQFHHAACDGAGAIDFLEDLLKILAAGSTAQLTPLKPLYPQQLSTRGRYQLTALRLLKSLPQQARGLEGVWQFLANRPMRLTTHNPSGNLSPLPIDRRPVARLIELDSHLTAALRHAARQAGVSVNELAAGELFQSLHASLPAQAKRDTRSVIRRSIPMNLRQEADRKMPAANIVSMIFLDRTAAQIANPAALLASIHTQMNLIKRLGLGMTFIFTLWVARRLPGGIRKLLGNQTTAATALFTNLGRVLATQGDCPDGRLQIGQNSLLFIEILGPLRQGTAVAVGATEYVGSLRFTLRYDPAAVSFEQAAALGTDFKGRLLQRAAGSVLKVHLDGS